MSGTPVSLAVESLVREVLDRESGRAVFTVASGSMRPRMAQGDRVVVEKVRPAAIRPGDVIVFRSESAGLVVHRVIWRDRPLGRPTTVYTRGDALDRLDHAVPVDRVVGRVAGIVTESGLASPATIGDRLRCVLVAGVHGLRRLGRRLLRAGGP